MAKGNSPRKTGGDAGMTWPTFAWRLATKVWPLTKTHPLLTIGVLGLLLAVGLVGTSIYSPLGDNKKGKDKLDSSEQSTPQGSNGQAGNSSITDSANAKVSNNQNQQNASGNQATSVKQTTAIGRDNSQAVNSSITAGSNTKINNNQSPQIASGNQASSIKQTAVTGGDVFEVGKVVVEKLVINYFDAKKRQFQNLDIRFKMPEVDSDKLKQILAEGRKSPNQLTDSDLWTCAMAALLLTQNGDVVNDFNFWVNDDILRKLEVYLKSQIPPLVDQLRQLNEGSRLFLLHADVAFAKADWIVSMQEYEKYREFVKQTTLQNDSVEREYFRIAGDHLGTAYLNQADVFTADGKIDEAAKLRRKAADLYYELDKATDLALLPSLKDRKPAHWIETVKSPPKGSVSGGERKAEVRSGKELTYLWLYNESSSFAYSRIITKVVAKNLYLQWQWKLDVMPESFEDPTTKCSVNHPLSVIVGFKRAKDIVALHYVWDPIRPRFDPQKDPVAGQWIDPDTEPLDIPPFRFYPVYPHIVVASGQTTLGKWHSVERNITDDYKVFFPKDDVPPIFGVRIQTNCQYPVDAKGVAVGQKRISQGAVGRLEFVEKSEK